MAKDPSFDWWLDRQIDEHMTPELEEEEEEEEGEGSMPNGISILNTTVCRNLNLPPIKEGEEEDEDCTLCEKEVGETCECFICAGCSELALGSECHSNKKDEGMYCKDCSKEK